MTVIFSSTESEDMDIVISICILVLAVMVMRWAFAIVKGLNMTVQGKSFWGVLKFFSQWVLLTVFCSFSGCITSYCSGFFTVATDYTRKDIEGVILYKGFPVWFYEAADGISIMSGWHFERFNVNWCVWTVFFMVIVVLVWHRIRRMGKTHERKPPPEAPPE